MRIALIVPVAAVALAGCDANPPTITTADIDSFNANAAAARSLPQTAINDLPAGTVTYDGGFGSGATVEGIDTYSMLGDMEMTVKFGNQEVSGTIDNINLIRDGVPQQRMGGDLKITGTAVNGVIDATAGGTLDREAANKIEVAFTDFDMNGIVQTGLNPADTVSGTVTGGGSGQFTFVLDGNGTFYGVANQ